MKRDVGFVALVAVLLTHSATTVYAEAWPCWRGPRGDGTCVEKNVPATRDSAGALWKTELPGQGHASPIVWGDRVLTVAAPPATQERALLCLGREDGKTLWRINRISIPAYFHRMLPSCHTLCNSLVNARK